jgi:hypothetical protein
MKKVIYNCGRVTFESKIKVKCSKGSKFNPPFRRLCNLDFKKLLIFSLIHEDCPFKLVIITAAKHGKKINLTINFYKRNFVDFGSIDIRADMTFTFKEIQITFPFIIFSDEFYIYSCYFNTKS